MSNYVIVLYVITRSVCVSLYYQPIVRKDSSKVARTALINNLFPEQSW